MRVRAQTSAVLASLLAVSCFSERVSTKTVVTPGRDLEPLRAHVLASQQGKHVTLVVTVQGQCPDAGVDSERTVVTRSEVSGWTMVAAVGSAAVGLVVTGVGAAMDEDAVPVGAGLVAFGAGLYTITKGMESERRETSTGKALPAGTHRQQCTLAPLAHYPVEVTMPGTAIEGNTDGAGRMSFEGKLTAPLGVLVSGKEAIVEWRE